MDAPRFDRPPQLNLQGTTQQLTLPLVQQLSSMTIEEQEQTLAVLCQPFRWAVTIFGIENFSQTIREVIHDPTAGQEGNYRTRAILTRMNTSSHSANNPVTTLSQLHLEDLKLIGQIANFISSEQGILALLKHPRVNLLDEMGSQTGFFFTVQENYASTLGKQFLYLKLNYQSDESASLAQGPLPGFAVLLERRFEINSLFLQDQDLGATHLTLITLVEKNLEGINLSNSSLSMVSMESSVLKRAILINATLTSINLKFTNLMGADFSNAKLILVKLTGAIIDATTKFDNTTITLQLPEQWNLDNLDQHLNHLNNSETGSLLTTINRINDVYCDLKINLMHQILDSLNAVDISSVRAALLDVLLSNPIYLHDKKIMAFIQDRLFGSHIEEANFSLLKVTGKLELQFFLNLITELAPEEQKNFMLHNNGFFTQLMMLCTEKGMDQQIVGHAQKLYHAYLAIPELQGAKIALELAGSDPNLVDGVTKDHQGNLMDAGLCFAFFKQEDDVNHILLVSRTQIRSLLIEEHSSAWNELYYLTGKTGEEQGIPDHSREVAGIVQHFNLFQAGYRFQQNKIKFPVLLEALNLNYQGESAPAKDYGPLFIETLSKPRSVTKLISSEDHTRLLAIFEPCFKTKNIDQPDDPHKPIEIKPDHFDQIAAIYDFGRATLTVQAQTLCCLAFVFTKYSSTMIFGVEGDSPAALRSYAAALLVKAYELDPGVFGKTAKEQQENYTDWLDRILKRTHVLDCSAVAAQKITDHIKQQPTFQRVLDSIKPLAWTY